MLRSRMVREGSVGVLALLGLLVFGGAALWLKGIEFGKKSYNIIVEFEDASGLQPGSRVLYRGVEVGTIQSLQPTSKGVDVTVEIAAIDLRIPRKVEVQTVRYGLIGESIIAISPVGSLSPEAQSMNPMSPDCNDQLILCHNTRLSGKSETQLFSSLGHLSEVYSDPKFFNNINAAAANAALAAGRIVKLSDELIVLSSSTRQNIKRLPTTIDAVNELASQTSNRIGEITDEFSLTSRKIRQLATSANELTVENRGNIVTTLKSIQQTSDRLSHLMGNLEFTVAKVNGALETTDTQKLVKNLEILTTNAAEASINLRDISKSLNDPQKMLILQQTLDSARATFENTQKITADLDELTGDPGFRSNVRKLIDGLSGLVSTTQQLQQQVQMAQTLEPITQELQQHLQTAQSLELTTRQLQRQLVENQGQEPIEAKDLAPLQGSSALENSLSVKESAVQKGNTH
jgi:phospholipid/cholesterol/gamma-HCH transport system substrate-binding protein